MMVINIICKFYIIHIITVVGLCQYMYYLIRIYHNTYNPKNSIYHYHTTVINAMYNYIILIIYPYLYNTYRLI